MRFTLVFLKSCCIGEDMVGEVVVLVNEEIDLLIGIAAYLAQIIELLHGSIFFQKVIHCLGR